MTVKKNGKANKGSQKWFQILVNEKPEIIDTEIYKKLNIIKNTRIEWKSPLMENQYVEYRDNKFLNALEIYDLKVPLDKFWPKRGPVWDGLAVAGKTKIIVEAKSHIPEMVSGKSKSEGDSKELITFRLDETKKCLNSKSEADWFETFYQYANRLAHLYYLRHLNNIDTHLVFIYFINDKEMKGPGSMEEWEGAIKLLHSYLGVGRHKLSRYVHDIFIDVNDLK